MKKRNSYLEVRSYPFHKGICVRRVRVNGLGAVKTQKIWEDLETLYGSSFQVETVQTNDDLQEVK